MSYLGQSNSEEHRVVVARNWGFPGGTNGKESALPIQEMQIRSLGPLEEKIAMHCSILAWRIHGGVLQLQSMGSQSVRVGCVESFHLEFHFCKMKNVLGIRCIAMWIYLKLLNY